MKKFFSGLAILTAVMLLGSCEDEFGRGGDGRVTFDENTIAFVIGGNSNVTRGAAIQTTVAPSNVFDLPGETADEPDFCLVETVTDMNEEVFDAVSETRATPVYTENFASLYGSDLYGTAFEPQEGSAQLTDVWGSYLENGGTVNFKPVEGTSNTYAYDYSRGQKVNLAWPEGGELLYFLQAPYATTSALNPKFYADGHIEFDYTDPTTPVSGVIANGAAAQKDFLFTSKVMEKDTKDTKNHVLLYHALTGVKFKVDNEDIRTETVINSVTLKGIKANGHCTITPNYTDDYAGNGNASNKKGAVASKSSGCSTWTNHSSNDDLVVDYVQEFSGVVDYTKGVGSNFADSFYDKDKKTHLNNLGKKDGSEILFMVPQELDEIEIEVNFTLKAYLTGTELGTYKRTVKLSSSWKAGEIHTYTLTVNKVGVKVEDSMSPSLQQKESLVLSNTGNVTAYFRATFALAWYYGYDADAVCVAAYQGNGSFEYSEGWRDVWLKGSDGFYYYKNPVLPGNSTGKKLFVSFMAPSISERGPFPGCHLEMNVLLQGVQYDKEKKKVIQAWDGVYVVGEDGMPTSQRIVDALSIDIENINI